MTIIHGKNIICFSGEELKEIMRIFQVEFGGEDKVVMSIQIDNKGNGLMRGNNPFTHIVKKELQYPLTPNEMMTKTELDIINNKNSKP